MTEPVSPQEMFELFQKMVNPMAFPMQSLLTASLNVGDIEKKIAELKTVEHWLHTNVAMLQMTIKTLEYQKSILENAGTPGLGGDAFASASKAGQDAFANAAAWWGSAMKGVTEATEAASAATSATGGAAAKSTKKKTK